MKLIRIIGILAILVVAVGVASAEQVATLTEDNSNIAYKAQLPDGLIQVTVTYNPVTGVIIYDYTGHTQYDGQHPYVTDPKIDEIGYNLQRDGSVTSTPSTTWAKANGNSRLDGFGTFDRDYTTDGSNVERISTVQVQLSGGSPYPLFATTGNVVALHLAFSGAFNADGSAIIDPTNGQSPKDATLGSTYLAGGVTQVPEFPTMVLPVAAILGLIFISQRKGKVE